MSVVVVGGGQAAGQLASTLRQEGYEQKITIITDEPYIPYQRPPLSKQYLQGQVDKQKISLRPQAFYDTKKIEVKSNVRVEAFDTKKNIVQCNDGTTVPYTDLVLATGSSPIRLKVPGADLENVFVFRTVEHVDAIRDSLTQPKRIVIIGGGYIGLEVAASCKMLGHEVSVVELEDRLLKRVTSSFMSDYFMKLHVSHGVDLHLGKAVDEIVGDETGSVASVHCSDGTSLKADVVIVGVGIRPVTQLADQQNLPVENGIKVDEYCRTTQSNIYAIGDCTNHPNTLLDRRLRLECVPNAMEQSRVAAQNIVGKDVKYESYPWFWSDQYDVKLQMSGILDEYEDMVVLGDIAEGKFALFYFNKGMLCSADAVNSPREFIAAKQLIGKPVTPEALRDQNVELKELVQQFRS